MSEVPEYVTELAHGQWRADNVAQQPMAWCLARRCTQTSICERRKVCEFRWAQAQ